MKLDVLMVGSRPPPYHGQAICFEIATEANRNKAVIETSFRSETVLGSILKSFEYLKKTIYYRYFESPETIYFLASRSLVGGFRDIFLILLFWNTECRIINHLHGADFKQYLSSIPAILKPVLLKIYSRIDLHILLSSKMKDQILDHFPKANVTSVRNFANAPAIDSESLRKSNKSFVFLSSLALSKGILDTIESIDYLYSNDNKITLDIAGPFLGDEHKSESEIKLKFFEKIENKPYIKFHGTLGYEEKFALLRKCRHFILPTFYKSEACPLSIIEAMMCCCTIITTDHNYLGKIFCEDNGVIIPPCNPQIAGIMIEDFLKHEDRIESIGIHNEKEARLNHTVSQYQSAISRLCNPN